MTLRILYITISGNTRSFCQRLAEYSQEQVALDKTQLAIEVKEISDNSLFEIEPEPFVAIVPTYLDGGNGVDSGTNEIMTNALGEYIEHEDNAARCIGVIGNGNKNFNWQYCLTGKQYAEKFSVPFLAEYELRGTPDDLVRIYQVLSEHVKSLAK